MPLYNQILSRALYMSSESIKMLNANECRFDGNIANAMYIKTITVLSVMHCAHNKHEHEFCRWSLFEIMYSVK